MNNPSYNEESLFEEASLKFHKNKIWHKGTSTYL